MQRTNKPYEGLFITIEGSDGSGKSTISEMIAAELKKRGFDILKTREPGGTSLSEHIRELLLNSKDVNIGEKSELLLFLAARAQHIEEKILPALRQGKVVICERFNDSTIAYQGFARHLGYHYVEQLCKCVTEAVEPDCTLFLDTDPEICLQRVQQQRGKGSDRLEQENIQFHREVRQGFLHLADQYPQRITIIDAAPPIETVLKSALKALEPYLVLKPSKH